MDTLNLDRPAGVFAAVLTPFDEIGAPNSAALALHCRWLLSNGCDGLSVFGTTGEGNSLSVDERAGLLERLVSDGIPAQVLLPATGCCAIPDTVRLTERAVHLGVPGTLMLPPFYYKNPSEDGVFAAFAEVIERVGDGRLRVYLYHFPQMSGVSLTPALIERLLARYPDSVAGMKDSSGDLANMAENRQAVSRRRRVQRLGRAAVTPPARGWRRLHHRRVQRRRFNRRSGVRGMARRRRGRRPSRAQTRLSAIREEFLAVPALGGAQGNRGAQYRPRPVAHPAPAAGPVVRERRRGARGRPR